MNRTAWMTCLTLVALSAAAGCAATQPSQRERLPERASAFDARPIDATFDDVMARYRLPGLALGVVRNGEIVYRRTAGELVVGSGERVTPDSLFKIASNSKAMTTGALARLVDAGKLRWDDPVTRYLPQFRMHDPWVTREIQVRDLLIHNSGLREGAGDLMLWPEPNLFTRADIIAGLAHLKPVNSFRSRYDYDNLMYVVAGEVAAAAAGTSYEELVRRELFEPLQMSRCQVGEWGRDQIGNVAQPHMRQGDTSVVIRGDAEIVPVSTSAAAGGIRCSLNDMLKWVRMWLEPDAKPAPDRPAWVSREQRNALWAAHTPMPISTRQREWDGSRFNAYGYGWRLSDVDGVLRVAHTGTLAGMYSAVTLLPEQQTGFVFMINGDGSEARTVLNTVVAKLLIARAEVRPVAYYADQLARERQEESAQAVAATGAIARSPVAASELAAWLGVYRDPWFGEVSICERDGNIELSSARSPLLTGTVMRSEQQLLVDWRDDSVDAEAWLDFHSQGEGSGATMQWSKLDPRADFSYDYEDLLFTRTRACESK